MIGRSCSHRAACYIRFQIRFRPTEEFWKKRSAEIRILHFPKEIAVFFSKLIASGLQFLPIRSIKFWQDILIQKPTVIQVHELILVAEIYVKDPSACEAGHDYFARRAKGGAGLCLRMRLLQRKCWPAIPGRSVPASPAIRAAITGCLRKWRPAPEQSILPLITRMHSFPKRRSPRRISLLQAAVWSAARSRMILQKTAGHLKSLPTMWSFPSASGLLNPWLKRSVLSYMKWSRSAMERKWVTWWHQYGLLLTRQKRSEDEI